MRSRLALVSAAVAFALGCNGSPTQLIVVVDTDLEIPAELDQVRVTVNAGAERMASEAQALSSDGPLPLTLAVAPQDDFLGPIEVLAEGRLDGDVVITRRARVTLVRGETRMLRLDLFGSCVGIDCAEAESCGESGCADIDVATLPPFEDPPPRVVDAGPMDGGGEPDSGGVDAGRLDAGALRDAGMLDAGPPVGCLADPECDDGIACTIDRCMNGFCTAIPDDSVCDDGNGCTDDVCTASGCAEQANIAPCDDGIFCNGFDRCEGGSCAVHTGDPCGSPTVCDEGGSQCTGCNMLSDCPAPTTGDWGDCVFDGGGCDEMGERARTNRTYACTGGACVPTDTPETETCGRTTEGDECGVGSCGDYGNCDYANDCDEEAEQTRTCTDLSCQSGECRATTRTESLDCSRSTGGDTCSATTCAGFGSCNWADGCDEMAVRSQQCMDFTCSGGMCTPTTRTETEDCNRVTTNNTCGVETCEMFGSCNWANSCDEMAQRSQMCSTPRCAGGTCSGSSSRTVTEDCNRMTDGDSCGAQMACSGGSCVSCTPTLSGAFGMTGAMTEALGVGNRLRFTNNEPASGDITVPGANFVGSAMAASCLWQITTSGNTISFTDFAGALVGSVMVSGVSVSGSASPPCNPSPYGCFPPCVNRVVSSGNELRVEYTNGAMGTLSFDCP